ncbi:hypothetical protein OGATHE_005363 [Ogataea polymorpha]|uniref:Uncharacterized protein n=1 Tax=Ogataea polymorpha TaxID=460523 RepID=A0A9P8NXH9_9ASCO|nr:hypothetical protein OGATHE_005363 [Ogataea polymorpha]
MASKLGNVGGGLVSSKSSSEAVSLMAGLSICVSCFGSILVFVSSLCLLEACVCSNIRKSRLMEPELLASSVLVSSGAAGAGLSPVFIPSFSWIWGMLPKKSSSCSVSSDEGSDASSTTSTVETSCVLAICGSVSLSSSQSQI